MCVTSEDNKQWIWIALDVYTRHVIAFHIGDRDRDAAHVLWQKLPEFYKQHADFYEAYVGVIPDKHYHRVSKQSRLTNHLERFNCTLRQCVSRLVGDFLAFSKKPTNHIGAIAYFVCHYTKLKTIQHYLFSTAKKCLS